MWTISGKLDILLGIITRNEEETIHLKKN